MRKVKQKDKGGIIKSRQKGPEKSKSIGYEVVEGYLEIERMRQHVIKEKMFVEEQGRRHGEYEIERGNVNCNQHDIGD